MRIESWQWQEGMMYIENNRVTALMNREKKKFRIVQMNEVISAVLSYFEICYSTLMSESRKGWLVRVRKMTAFVASMFGITHKQIGEALGKDRSTITNQIEDVRNDIRMYPMMKEDIDRIVRVLTMYEVENESNRRDEEV
jgi:chromosomal replication initiation ATPase DnaA